MVSPELIGIIINAAISSLDVVITLTGMWMSGSCMSKCCGATIVHEEKGDKLDFNEECKKCSSRANVEIKAEDGDE